MRSSLLILLILAFAGLQAQQIKLITEVERRPGASQATLLISAISKNDTSYTLDSVRMSVMAINACHTFSFASAGGAFMSWGFTNMQYLDSAFSTNYLGVNYDRRYYFAHQDHPGASSSLIIPDSSQTPIRLLEVRFMGSCPHRVYLESTVDNPNNTFIDSTGSLLTYCVEDRGWFSPNCAVNFIYAEDNPLVSLKYNFRGWGPYSDSVKWDFGDGTIIQGTAYRPSHTYTRPGIYDVCLSAVDTLGCSSSRCIKISVAQDTPVCRMDSIRVLQQRNRGSRAFTITPYSFLGDSVQIDLGDGSPAFKLVKNQSIVGYQYPKVDTYQVRAIAYANRYDGLQTCADTGYASVVVPKPEVRMCVELGPGNQQDTLFFSITNLTNDTLPVRSIGCVAFLDASCLNATGYATPLENILGRFDPITPRFFVEDTVTFTDQNGITYNRVAGLSHFRNTMDQTKSDYMLLPEKDTSILIAGFALSGSCKTHFKSVLADESRFFGNGVSIGYSNPDGTPASTYPALMTMGCSTTTSLEEVINPDIPQISIWPNPAGDLVLVSLKGAKPGTYHIRVRDALGRELQYWRRTMQNGLAIRLHLDDLPDGMYYVEVQDDAQQLPVMSQPMMVRK
ncbi:MAG: PKD domain-containing protein [Bacteroidia bacterium]